MRNEICSMSPNHLSLYYTFFKYICTRCTPTYIVYASGPSTVLSLLFTALWMLSVHGPVAVEYLGLPEAGVVVVHHALLEVVLTR